MYLGDDDDDESMMVKMVPCDRGRQVVVGARRVIIVGWTASRCSVVSTLLPLDNFSSDDCDDCDCDDGG